MSKRVLGLYMHVNCTIIHWTVLKSGSSFTMSIMFCPCSLAYCLRCVLPLLYGPLLDRPAYLCLALLASPAYQCWNPLQLQPKMKQGWILTVFFATRSGASVLEQNTKHECNVNKNKNSILVVQLGGLCKLTASFAHEPREADSQGRSLG